MMKYYATRYVMLESGSIINEDGRRYRIPSKQKWNAYCVCYSAVASNTDFLSEYAISICYL